MDGEKNDQPHTQPSQPQKQQPLEIEDQLKQTQPQSQPPEPILQTSPQNNPKDPQPCQQKQKPKQKPKQEIELPIQNTYEIKSDRDQSITGAEQTLLHNRDPIQPKEAKSQEGQQAEENEKEKEKEGNSEEQVQKTETKQHKIQQIKQQKKPQPKTQQKQQPQQQPHPLQQQQGKTSTQSQQKLEEAPSTMALQRPISIALTKDTLQILEHQKPHLTFKQPSVKIEITETIEKGFALAKQTYFRVTGFDQHGAIDILRKVEEFQALRKILLERWPGCFVPMLSQRSDTRSEEMRNLHRRKNLENFLKKLAYSEQIYYKEEVQLFLRSYGIDMEQMFQQMPVLRVRDVIQRFKGCFGEVVEQPNIPQNLSSIKRFSTSLKKIANNLNNLAKKVLRLAESYETYQQAIPNFSKFLTSYQQTCLSEYTNNPDRAIALRDTEARLGKLKSLQTHNNMFYDLYFLFECENRDAEALSEVILAMQMFNIKRDDLQSESKETREQIDQISLGHKNIKLITSRKTKQQLQLQLQTKQKSLIQQKHVILQLAGMSQIMLSQITIPLFKKMKINNYFNIVKKWVDTVGEINADVFEVWKFLEEESRQHLKKYTVS